MKSFTADAIRREVALVEQIADISPADCEAEARDFVRISSRTEAAEEWGIRWTEGSAGGRLTAKEKFFDTEKQRDAFAAKIEKSDKFHEFLAWSNPPGGQAEAISGNELNHAIAAVAKAQKTLDLASQQLRDAIKIVSEVMSNREADGLWNAARDVRQAGASTIQVLKTLKSL